MIDVHVPRLGMAMDSAILLSWSFEVGATVQQGDVLAEIEAEKAVTELESPVTGIVRELLANPNDELKPGDVIARIEPT